MSKRVYISADYAEDGDKDVTDILHKWGKDDLHKVDFTDMAECVAGSVADSDDCRPCDLKEEFNKQIQLSSMLIAIVGDKTKTRTAGSECERCYKGQSECTCTPYKQNTNGRKKCKVENTFSADDSDDIGTINGFSYLKHEFLEAEKRNKTIAIFYNSTQHQTNWLPHYMSGYEDYAYPFWKTNDSNDRVADYDTIKSVLGYD
ncbi:MAG: hypothetical protein SOI56_04380 [Eubacteriales bacterium]|jgi:hypothetical protein